ncbi:hypothetical protein QBC46DRAFT_321587 [Diplogelasinospora grovesii]|uniref:BTB domain-containing protein n=1 Tax=Diplogelasinospora grovesii TaxID=303347 RepID=A0AAN6N0D2_9PEZI|nr:hypothetical protein QBC46DRAFT_321587 [Diplogelasinospora grovesii]
MEVLDSRGDLVLVVGQEKKEFLVCSRTLARASPNFAAKLFSEGREFSPVSGSENHVYRRKRRISFPEISVTAMHAILLIVHGAPTQVFGKLNDVNLLHDVLVITTRFEMTECLAPVAVKWLRKTYKAEVLRFDEVARQLYITYQLGHLPCVKQTLLHMVMSLRLNSRSELIGYGASDHDEFQKFLALRSLNLLDPIYKCRQAVITRLVKEVEQAVERLTRSPRVTALDNKEAICKAASGQTKCDCTLLGAFYKVLHAEGWSHIDLKCSPNQLYKRVKKIGRQTQEMAEPNLAHKFCDPFGGQLPSLEQIVSWEVNKIRFEEAELNRLGKALGFERLKGPREDDTGV